MYGVFCLCKTPHGPITIITKNEPNPDMCTILPTLLQSRVSEKNEKCPKMHTEIINLINKRPLSM
jgi:hypothetical protein